MLDLITQKHRSVTISAPNQANGKQATAVASISNAAGTILSVQIDATGSWLHNTSDNNFCTSCKPVWCSGSRFCVYPRLVMLLLSALQIQDQDIHSAPAITITGGGRFVSQCNCQTWIGYCYSNYAYRSG
jgi:hypothetical protein